MGFSWEKDFFFWERSLAIERVTILIFVVFIPLKPPKLQAPLPVAQEFERVHLLQLAALLRFDTLLRPLEPPQSRLPQIPPLNLARARFLPPKTMVRS